MPRSLGHVVGAGLLAATLLNGLGAYAKRVGAIERQAYEHYWVLRCGVGGVSERWFGLGRRCAVPEPLEGYTMRRPPLAAYVFAVQGYEWPMKAAKDAVMLGLAGIGAVATLRNPSRRLHFRHAVLPALLAA